MRKIQRFSLPALLAAVLMLTGCGTSSPSFTSPLLPEGETIIEFADTPPELIWTTFALIYPPDARRKKLEGRSVVQFVVDR